MKYSRTKLALSCLKDKQKILLVFNKRYRLLISSCWGSARFKLLYSMVNNTLAQIDS